MFSKKPRIYCQGKIVAHMGNNGLLFQFFSIKLYFTDIKLLFRKCKLNFIGSACVFDGTPGEIENT